MNVPDSLAFAMRWDSLRAVLPDTMFVSPLDTVNVALSESRHWRDWITPVCAALSLVAIILGWIVINRNNLRAQEKGFYNKIVYDAGQEMSVALDRAFRWSMMQRGTLHHIGTTGVISQSVATSISESFRDPSSNSWAQMVNAHGDVLWNIVPQFFDSANALSERQSRANDIFEHAAFNIGTLPADEFYTLTRVAIDEYYDIASSMLQFRELIVERVLVEVAPHHSYPFNQRIMATPTDSAETEAKP